jgi:hypothetical protein
MLEAVEEAGDALVGAIELSRTQIKNKLKEMSPIEGRQAVDLQNSYDLLDSHGSQNLSKTMAHITPKKKMSGSQARQVLDPNSRQSVEILASDMAADYLNNLPDSDPRKPKKPIVPEYNVVSGLGMDGVSNKTNKALDLGTQSTEKLITELEDIEPVKRWGTLLEQNGMSAEEYGGKVQVLDQKLMNLIRTHGKTKATISDSDLSGMMDQVLDDPEVSPEIKNAVRRSKNMATGARASGVGKTDRANMEAVVRSGEVVVPGLENPETFTVAASGKAQGGESGTARTKGIGFFDPAEEARLAAEAETLRPPKVKATEEDKADAEAEGAEIGKAALRGVRKGATTESPSREGKEVGKDIADRKSTRLNSSH